MRLCISGSAILQGDHVGISRYAMPDPTGPRIVALCFTRMLEPEQSGRGHTLAVALPGGQLFSMPGGVEAIFECCGDVLSVAVHACCGRKP